MSYTFSQTCDFGTGPPLGSLVAELVDPTGTVVASTAFSGFVDIGGGTGRQFEFSLTAPDGFTRGAQRVRDLNGVERRLVDSVNLIFPGASVIIPAPPLPSVVLPGTAINIAFSTVTLPSGVATDATGTPTASLQRNGALDATVLPVVTHTGTGLYSVAATVPAAYLATDLIALVVNATVAGVAAVAPIFQAALQAPPAAAPAGTAELYGYEFLNAVPVNGRTVTVYLLYPPQTSGTVILETVAATTVTGPGAVPSQPAGRWSVFLVPGKVYRLSIPEAGIDHTFTMPGGATDARTLL